MKLYNELASWWPLLSPPQDYAEEASLYIEQLLAAGNDPATTLLELGSGGGNNAMYLKHRFTTTLVDVSAPMLAVSRELNPDCEHMEGDMRTVRLGREFDRVFVHDAICYMTTYEDLLRALETAFVHCRPGGAVLLAPDYLRETFRSDSEEGGSDGDGRGLRYLAWVRDPNPDDCMYVVDYAYMLLDRDGVLTVEHEQHVEGLFSREEWLEGMRSVGFRPTCVTLQHSELEPGSYQVFVGLR